jgi:hypothetical protein
MAAKMGRKIYRKLKSLGETPRLFAFPSAFCASRDGPIPFHHFFINTAA